MMDVMSIEELSEIGQDMMHEDQGDMDYEAYDDVTGEWLDPAAVMVARKEELEYVKGMKVYEYAAVSECWSSTGKAPIGTRWIDINKGDEQKRNYRSRLVAKEYKVDTQPELYAATPPTECLRLMISKAAENREHKMLYVDVSRAYFYAPAVRATYVKLPSEDPRPNDPSV